MQEVVAGIKQKQKQNIRKEKEKKKKKKKERKKGKCMISPVFVIDGALHLV